MSLTGTLASTASAQDYFPPLTQPGLPKPTLFIGEETQPGVLYEFRFLNCGPSDCVGGSTGPAFTRFPASGLPASPGQRAKVLIRTRERLRGVGLSYWTAIGAFAQPVGASIRLAREVAQVGPRRWRVRFVVPPLGTDAFLSLKVGWHEPGLPRRIDREYAVWGFRISPR